MPPKIVYSSSNIKIREAVDKANTILQDKEFYQLIRNRSAPFQQSLPANLPPALIADILENSTETPFLREVRALPTVAGRFVNRYPKVVWININSAGKHTMEALAAVLVHMCVYLISTNDDNHKFEHTDQPIASNVDTAPYWVQQLVRTHFCNFSEQKLSTQYLLKVEVKSNTNSAMNFKHV